MQRSLKSRPVSDSQTTASTAIHLHPTAPLAERVLLPGDPGRALMLAQSLLAEPRMFNHNRGLWGYSGEAADGRPLTIQATGMGGPSAAIVAEELIGLGARVLLRIGTCGALTDELSLGQLVAVSDALAEDGTSRALGAGERAQPDADLTARLASDAAPVTVVSTDVFYEERDGVEERWVAAGAKAVEMESATLFTVAHLRGVRAASLLAVSDLLSGGRERLDQEAVDAVGVELGAAALRALA
jgi:uridine phosphorylase